MKTLIANTLIELLELYSYKEISVRVICEIVPISRPTFYNHFQNKDNVAMWFVREDFMKNCFPVFQYHLKEKGVETYFHYLKKHKNFYLRLYEYDDGVFLKQCLENAYLHAFDYRDQFSLSVDKKKGTINPEIFTRYSIGGISSIIIYWIEKKMEIPVETIAYEMYLMMEQSMTYVRDYYL